MNKAARILLKKGRKLEAAGKHADAISTYEAALSASPNDPDILFAIGNVARRLDMLPIAEEMFRAVYGLRPDSIEAATNLAIAIADQDRIDEAVDIYQSILAVKPEHVGTWINIGNAMLSKDDTENAEIFYSEALRLKPSSVEALSGLSELKNQNGELEEALTLTDKALRRDKRNPMLRYNRGEILLALGQLEEGWKDHEFGSQNRKDRQIRYHHKIKRWKGEDLSGKKILLTCEQGVGDQVRFLNTLEQIISLAEDVVVEIDPRLKAIVERTYPEIKVQAFNAEKIANVTHFNYDGSLDHFDFHCSMLGTYRYLKPDVGSFDNDRRIFVTDDGLDKKWNAQVCDIATGLKVGICWRSGKMSLNRSKYYTEIGDWEKILKLDNISFFSLMYDDCSEEISEAKKMFGADIHSFDDLDYKNDLDNVFSLTRQMDVVVSVNSAPACFAGALGISTLVPSRGLGWERMGTDDMVMIPAMTPVLQKTDGDWKDVMADIADSLKKFQ